MLAFYTLYAFALRIHYMLCTAKLASYTTSSTLAREGGGAELGEVWSHMHLLQNDALNLMHDLKCTSRYAIFICTAICAVIGAVDARCGWLHPDAQSPGSHQQCLGASVILLAPAENSTG
jgi:hypothetical protein